MIAFCLVMLVLLVARLVGLVNKEYTTEPEAWGCIFAIVIYLGLIAWDCFLLLRHVR